MKRWNDYVMDARVRKEVTPVMMTNKEVWKKETSYTDSKYIGRERYYYNLPSSAMGSSESPLRGEDGSSAAEDASGRGHRTEVYLVRELAHIRFPS